MKIAPHQNQILLHDFRRVIEVRPMARPARQCGGKVAIVGENGAPASRVDCLAGAKTYQEGIAKRAKFTLRCNRSGQAIVLQDEPSTFGGEPTGSGVIRELSIKVG